MRAALLIGLLGGCGASGVIRGSGTGGATSSGPAGGSGGGSAVSGASASRPTSTGSSSGASTGTSIGTTGTSTTGPAFLPAPHAPFPQLTFHGGAVITAPELVTITFPGDESYDVPAFVDWLVQSDWLLAVGADYGVTSASHVADLASSAAVGATVDDLAIQAFVGNSALDGGLPRPSASTVYLLVFPAGVTITNSAIGQSCQSFGGYHSAFDQGGSHFVYAVVPTCPSGEAPLAPYAMSVIASHEILEAATDPGGDGFILSGGPWTALGSEDGDLCQGAFFLSDAGYLVQRLWSNSAAVAGDSSPCVPQPPGASYFNLTADAQAGDAGDFAAHVQTSSAAQEVSFTLTAWSTAPLSFALGLTQLSGPTIGANVKGTSGKPAMLQNGSQVVLTLTLPAGVASGTDIDLALTTSADGFASQNLAPLRVHVD